LLLSFPHRTQAAQSVNVFKPTSAAFFSAASTNETGYSFHHDDFPARLRLFFLVSWHIGLAGFPAAMGFLHFWVEYLLINPDVFYK